MSESSEPSSSTSGTEAMTTKPTRLIRNRFPKAQPNIGLSNSMARIRRLSGHFATTTTDDTSSTNAAPVAQQSSGDYSGLLLSTASPSPVVSTPPPPPHSQSLCMLFSPQQQHQQPPPPPPPPSKSSALQQHHQLIETVLLSPHVNNQQQMLLPDNSSVVAASQDQDHIQYQDHIGTPKSSYTRQQSTMTTSTFRQLVMSSQSPISSNSGPSSIFSQPYTPGGGNGYKPQFTKEHVMNIIKFKAMQKLKKNESEVGFYFYSALT